MTQTIECTECHDIIDLEGGRVITIPFICRVCETSTKPLQPGLECNNVGCGCHVTQPVSKYEPSAEGEPIGGVTQDATQDATAIISDLQQQLNQLTDYVTDIEAQLQNSRQESLMHELRATSLENDNKFINQQNTEVTKQLATVRRNLKSALDIAAHLA